MVIICPHVKRRSYAKSGWILNETISLRHKQNSFFCSDKIYQVRSILVRIIHTEGNSIFWLNWIMLLSNFVLQELGQVNLN